MPNKSNQNNSGRRAPSFSVHDEIKRNRRIRKNKKIRKALTATQKLFTALLCAFVVLLTAVAILLAVMRVKNVAVEGNGIYSQEEILAAAEVDNSVLPFISKNVLQSKIIAACPYVDSVELEKNYPSDLKIVVTEAKAVYSITVHEKQYSLDRNLRVIDTGVPSAALVTLSLPDISRAEEGKKIEFYASAEYVFETLAFLFDGEDPLPFTHVDLSSRFHIFGVIGDTAKIEFGSVDDFSRKLIAAKKLLKIAEEKDSQRTLIKVSVLTGNGPSAIHDYEHEF